MKRTAQVLIQGGWSNGVVVHVPGADFDQLRRYLGYISDQLTLFIVLGYPRFWK